MEDASTVSYETQMERLLAVVERLERGTLSLEQSLELFEEGMSLSRLCDQQLSDVEARVRVLVDGAQELSPRKEIDFQQIQIPTEDEE